MPITQTTRQTLDGQTFRSPYAVHRATNSDNTTLSLTKLLAAPFLPVLAKDHNRQVPYVMYPGTIVGLLNARDHAALIAKFGEYSPNLLVPASMAATYKIHYTADDFAGDEYGGSLDLDGNGSQFVTATGLSSDTIATVRPLGIVQEPIVSRAYQLRHRNLQFQTKPNLMCSGQVLRIPAITSEELLIDKGDRLTPSDGAGNWAWRDDPTAAFVGRWKRYPAAGSAALAGYIVGTCVDKQLIISQSAASAGSLLLDDITGDLLDDTSLNTDEDFHIAKRIQTTPGLALQGSGLKGIPENLTFARADASGNYYFLDIAVSFVGIA